MTETEERYYSPKHWQNWLTRIEEENLNLESEETGHLLTNIQNNAAVAITKILAAYDDDTLGEGETPDELSIIHDIVMTEPEFEAENEEAEILVGSVQANFSCAFLAAGEFIVAGPAELEGDMDTYIRAAADAEAADDLDSALGYVIRAGTRVIDGEGFDIEVFDELEFGLAAEWVNGSDSLQGDLSGPEVIEEED